MGVTTDYLTFVTQTGKLAQQIHHEPALIPLHSAQNFLCFDLYLYFDIDNLSTHAAPRKIIALNNLG